jgi:signal peptidase I
LSTPPSQGGEPPRFTEDTQVPQPQAQQAPPESQNQPAPQSKSTAPPSRAAKTARRRRLIIEYAIIIVVAVGLALLVQAYAVKPYRIPSGSMENTLMVGDRVFVNRFIYHFRSVHRGDIVVFREPGNGPGSGTVLIKRVIGLPGDVITLHSGSVYINQRRLSEPYVRPQRNTDGTLGPEPTLPFQDGMPYALAAPYTVPSGHYFMMGDNRTDSGDSRQFGPLPKGNIIGGAFLIYWPLNRIRIL